MGRGKKRPLLTKPKTAHHIKRAALDRLHSDPLLARCGNEKQPGYGELVWSKGTGYPFWPALVSKAPAEEDDEKTPADDPDKYAFVMYLEPKFRLSVVSWARVIRMDLSNFEEQKRLIMELNELEAKRTMSKAQKEAFILSCDLIKTFEPIPVSERNRHGEEKCREFKSAITPSNKTKKPKKRIQEMKNTDSNEKGNCDMAGEPEGVGAEPAPRLSNAYKFRPTVKVAKIWDSSKIVKPTDENSDAGSTASLVPIKKKPDRPAGGEALRDWTIEKFDKIDKLFRFETINPLICSKCSGSFSDSSEIYYCHELPFHQTCLVSCIVRSKDKDKEEQETVEYKCEDCGGQKCFICHKGAKDEGGRGPVKCSRCDLRFHRECLNDEWPQAEIIGSVGQITCPLHFCHTCKWEHRFTGKVRNYKLPTARGMRCIYCFASYHKNTCIPAGTGNTIMKNQLIICPRHTGRETHGVPKKTKRLGCFTCYKKISLKDDAINCKMCPLFFHLKCVYTEEQARSGTPLEEYRKEFKCEGCRWGLFPLYGQVVWYQQPASTYWPSLVMYPKESLAIHKFHTKTQSAGAFGVLYCGYGGKGLSFHSGRSFQTIPFDIASEDFLKKLNMYSHIKVESAEKEGFHLLKLTEAYRSEVLPDAEPIYKHIEKNVMRIPTNQIRAKAKPKGNLREELDVDEVCLCATPNGTEDVCTANSSCFNRAVHMECTDTTCAGGTRCRNRMFTNKADHMENRLEYFVSSSSKGWGVRTTVKLPEDTFIIEYVGELISKAEMCWREDRKLEVDPLYFLEIDTNTYIDAEYLGNMSRLINHSCDPNCKTEKYYTGSRKPVVGIFALRDIEIGEELTFNYNFGSKKSMLRFKCRCNSDNCRGFIGQSNNDENLMPSSGRNPTAEAEYKWDDECSVCGLGGLLLMCEFGGCSKCYHAWCAGLAKAPEGSWICPNHGDAVKRIMPNRVTDSVLKKPKLNKPATKIKTKEQNGVIELEPKSDVPKPKAVARITNGKAKPMITNDSPLNGNRKSVKGKRAPATAKVALDKSITNDVTIPDEQEVKEPEALNNQLNPQPMSVEPLKAMPMLEPEIIVLDSDSDEMDSCPQPMPLPSASDKPNSKPLTMARQTKSPRPMTRPANKSKQRIDLGSLEAKDLSPKDTLGRPSVTPVPDPEKIKRKRSSTEAISPPTPQKKLRRELDSASSDLDSLDIRSGLRSMTPAVQSLKRVEPASASTTTDPFYTERRASLRARSVTPVQQPGKRNGYAEAETDPESVDSGPGPTRFRRSFRSSVAVQQMELDKGYGTDDLDCRNRRTTYRRQTMQAIQESQAPLRRDPTPIRVDADPLEKRSKTKNGTIVSTLQPRLVSTPLVPSPLVPMPIFPGLIGPNPGYAVYHPVNVYSPQYTNPFSF